MRLYSRFQLVLFSFLSFAIAIMLAAGFGLFNFRKETRDVSILPEDSPSGVPYTLDAGSPPLAQSLPVNVSKQYTADEVENIQVYDTFNQGVVNITSEIITYNWFLDPVPQEGGSGSGIIFDKRGYVLTNHHVVEKAYKVFVSLSDGSQYEGEVIGSDPENDLAVVKIDPQDKNLVTIPFGTSQGLRVGQKVMAIGNPFGYERTLTTGIVSGTGRPLKNSRGLVMQNMIQTDASINPGNSGGPLLDSKGQMIGINTMIYSPSGGSVGIGFAVPIDTVRRVVPDLIEFGTVRRGWIDVVPVQLFPSLVRYAKLPVNSGLLVNRVIPGGNADDVGIKGGQRSQAVRTGNTVIYLGGDIIVAVDGNRVDNLFDLYAALEDNKPGERIMLQVVRGRKNLEFEIILSDRPQQFQWE